ncbi:obscurin-like isoform X2 [Centruroides vittatus]|uniref:obscurin-like isoform X2 n=1 Tax=Centruroides vittatus TaxID=120091 RepID=UPI00350F5BFD
MKDGNEIKPSDRVKIETKPDGSTKLVINQANPNDAGEYSVVANNNKGKADSQSKVTVEPKVKKSKPNFIKNLENIECSEKKQATFEAKVSGEPKADVAWFKDGKKIEYGQKFSSKMEENGHISLTINDVTTDDAGEYKAIATNEIGDASSTAKLTVIPVSPPKEEKPAEAVEPKKPEPKKVPEPSKAAEVESAKVPETPKIAEVETPKEPEPPVKTPTIKGKVPEFSSYLKPAQFYEGESGQLIAKVTGEPMPKIKWMKNGKPILPSDHIKLSESPDGTVTLTFDKVTPDDAGKYTLVISNEAGEEKSEAPVAVIPATKKADKAPKFKIVEGLQPLMVPEGEPGRFQIKVLGEGKPIIIWKKDGKDLISSDHIKLVEEPGGVFALTIDKAVPSDVGKYAVVIIFDNGEEKSEALMTVVPKMEIPSIGKKPEFLQSLQPKQIALTQPVVLQAKVIGEPKPSIKWLKDGEEIRPTSNITMIEEPDGTIALKIDSVDYSDAGKYVAVATNIEGKTRNAAAVDVLVPARKKPEFLTDLQPVTCNDGDSVTLKANIAGEPKPKIKWIKDGNELKPTGNFKQIEEPDGTISLQILKVTPKDAGKYALAIANDEGETRSSAPLTVNQPPVFTKPLLSVTVINGFPGKLEAKVSGVPRPTIEWLKNGQPFLTEGDHVKLYNPDGTVAILFEKCKPEHAGKYSCVAKNGYGDCTASGELEVIEKELDKQLEAAPAFLSNLYDVSAKENETIKFEASVSGNPLPDVHWFLDEQPVLPSNNIHPMFDGKKVSLEIKKCNPQHAGNYECHLVNRVGNAISAAKAKVMGFTAPKFIQKLVDMEVPTTEPARLTCRVSGFPEPCIEWYRNGDLLYPGIKYSMSREGDQCHLNIPYPRGRDSGVFECQAKNVVGEEKCSAKVIISDTAEHGEAPIFLKRLIDIEALEGSSAKFTACITGVPKPLVKWFKSGEQLEPSKHYTMEHEHNGILRLIIYQLKPSDIGEYRVSVSNKYGSDTCTANLHLAGVDEYVPHAGATEGEKQRKTGPPSPLPDPPFIMRMTDTHLTLGWRPSVPSVPRVPVTYEVEMCQEPDGKWNSYRSGLKDSVCDIRGLIPNQDYRFRIRVENKHGISDPSPYVSAYRSKLRPPTPADYKPKDYEIEHPPLDKHAAAPRFLRQEEEVMYGIRGQPVRIEFWVYGHPQPEISWLFNGVQVDPGKYDFLQDRNGQVILFITRMTENDIGSYVCHATNEHGEARQKIKVLIAESPIFTKKLEETAIMMRGGGKFECCVTGVPTPKIKWFKDWHPLYESSRIKIQWTDPDKCNLSLDGAILKDSGLYSCCASNVAGSASTSASLSVEESQSDYNYYNYNAENAVKPRNKIFEEFYDIGDELGRGTQGIIYHAVERNSGKSFAAKMMHGTGKIRSFIDAEMDIMNHLSHPRLVRLWDAFESKSALTLITDLCGGGELLNNLTQREKLTESDIAHYIKQVLEGVEHMHSKFIGHLGLTIGDLLITRVNSDNLRICDFGLATRLNPGREFIQLYGHPEFVAPEIANKQPVSLASDMWSIGIITYLLLTGSSPFLAENDRETLKNVQQGKVNFFHDNYVVLSDEAKDFVSKLLVVDPSGRIDVKSALKHPWLRFADIPDKCDELNCLNNLRDYYKKWREWHSNASCRRFYRRRPLDSCFTHPSRMIYPHDVEYTPPSTPERHLGHSHVKPAAFDDVTFQQKIVREPIDFRSESQYQSGPDTFLLPLHDREFPIRVRQYLRLGARRSPTLAEHLRQKHWGDSEITVKERRRFVDVMDKEISDEKRGLVHSTPLRLQKEFGSLGTETGRKRSIQNAEASPPYFREKIRDVVIREDEDAVFKCFAVSKPPPLYSWFRNDGILIESSRIEMKHYKDGHCELRLKPAKGYDVGLYKCVARNTYGVITCRARLKIGDVPGHPEPPTVQQCSDTELYAVWNPPKSDGNSPILCYSLEYKKSDEDQWSKAAKNIAHEFFVIRDLTPSSTYYLRLAAKNRFGWGDYSQPSEPCNTLVTGSPKVKISKARKYQQEMTERGQELFLDDLESTNLDYSLEDNPIELTEGDPLELYNFVSEVARGRFSITVKVWVKQKNTTLIAKVLQKTPQTESSILHEFDILRSLKHERIVSLEMASTNPTATIFIMEKLSGMDILTYFSCRHQYTEEMVAKVVTQVLDALEYLHFRGICYLELQPDNVVLTDQHHLDVKLVDFGSAQCIPPEGARVNIRGSLEYLAPEILKQEDASTASDLWGVGVLTYILLSGVSPFHGENDVETTSNVLYVRYHFDNLYKEVTQEATRFLMQLFKRTPQKRPTIEECFENKWLIPSEFMIRKREHAIFLTHRIHEFSEQFHAQKRLSSPPALLNMFGMSISKSVSLETDTLEEF